jgi:hypothetical protein
VRGDLRTKGNSRGHQKRQGRFDCRLYPPGIYAEKIADAVKELFSAKGKESEDLFFDDLELLTKESAAEAIKKQKETDSEDLEEVVEEDFESVYEDEEKEPLDKLDSSLKIADDEFEDTIDES